MARKPDPKSKAGFVRALPSTLSAAEVVAKAKGAGIKLDASYVYAVRGAKKARRKGRQGPGRLSGAPVAAVSEGGSHVGKGIVAEIERIVERKIAEVLRGKLGAMFGA